MELIDYDVRDRKSLARASRYKKNGSKSKKCMLPSDRLTDAQIRQRNGGLTVYQIGKPITWDTFKAYPLEMQKEYLKHFAKEHNCNVEMLANMMGCKKETLQAHTTRKGLSGIVARKPSVEAQMAFYRWVESQKNPAEPEEIAPEKSMAEEPKKVEMPARTKSTIRCGSCKLEGSANEILLELQQMLKNEKVSMFVAWCRKEENNADAG